MMIHPLKMAAYSQQPKLWGREVELLLAASGEPDQNGHPKLQNPSGRCHSKPACSKSQQLARSESMSADLGSVKELLSGICAMP